MITTLFSKSRPLNYLIVACLALGSSIMAFHADAKIEVSAVIQQISCSILWLLSLLLINFITKRNSVSKENTFPILFAAVFVLFIPEALRDLNILIAHFFILLALRRLISMQSLLAPKEKIFDAALWISVAALFQFWCALYLFIVFVSIVLHVSRDYRNWILPYFGVITALIFAGMVHYFSDFNPISYFYTNAVVDLSFDYFQEVSQNAALSAFTAFACILFLAQLLSLSGKPLILHAAYKKVLFSFCIGGLIFVFSTAKANDLLLFTVFPLAVMTASFVEEMTGKWIKEIAVWLLVISAVTFFFWQL